MRLFIRILSAPGPADRSAEQSQDAIHCQWLLHDGRGNTVAQGESDAADILEADGVADAEEALADPDNIVVLVPSARVAWLSRTVPGRRAAQMRRALPFAVEEFLTQDVETLHLAHGPISRGQPVRCALIDRQLIAGWLARLADGGLRPGHMAPDACLLPCDETSASVLLEDGEALVRTPEDIVSVETSTLGHVLESVRASFGEMDEPLDLHLIGGDLSGPQTDHNGFTVRRTPLEGTVLDFLASRWDRYREEVNLLQGPFTPAKRARAFRGGWRSVAALAALWLIVTLGVLIAEGYVANHRADAIEVESAELYRSIYPNERRVPNAYAQMRAKLRESGAGSGAFHLLLGQLAAGTDRGTADINVRSITFNDSRSELTSELWLAGYAEIDALKRELEGQALAVDISSAEERDNVVRARLRVRIPEGASER
ncbi:MAG: type II secretion system protein GspL [Gammaproteobacteria bacterium]|nr:type II secretion system protein GspL [Gammaproteobacteria bacterium]